MAETTEKKDGTLVTAVEVITRAGSVSGTVNEACLIIVLGGNAVQKLGDALMRVAAGDVCVLFPGTECEYVNTESFRAYVIRFDYEELLFEAGALKNLKEFQLLFIHNSHQAAIGHQSTNNALGRDALKNVEQLAILIEDELMNRNPEYEEMARRIFLSVVAIICRYSTGKNRISSGSSIEVITSVATYMENNYADPIKLDDLAALTHYSCRHFTRLFQEHFRTSPMNYLNSIRMYKANNMIIKTSLSIEEVAHRSGFEDSGHFCRQFKRHYGQTPKQWRKQHTED
ncbi:MAG: helix-turn-helix domain-containing protein [Clostridia bacterium]|nr:helix-turn-helix domain-containing protein [Clostridia bacterium]